MASLVTDKTIAQLLSEVLKFELDKGVFWAFQLEVSEERCYSKIEKYLRAEASKRFFKSADDINLLQIAKILILDELS